MEQLPDQVRTRQSLAVRERSLPAYAVPLQPPQRPNFIETVRKLWRHRYMVLGSTAALGVLSIAVVTSLSSHYVAESRVLVGVPEPRIFSSDSFLPQFSPDAERVQNESFIIQSRGLAKQVIDRLHLADNPEFNPELSRAPIWQRYLGDAVSWLAGWRNKTGGSRSDSNVQPDPNAQYAPSAAESRENELIDVFLSKVDVSTLGRSHVLSILADSQNPGMAAAVANTLADAYLKEQRGNKVETTNRVEKYLMDRVAELRQQVEKSEQAVEDYRRQNGLYKGATTGLTSQQITELNTQLILAQTAKAEADSRLHEAQSLRSTGIEGDSVPEVLRSPLIQSLKGQEAAAGSRLAELSGTYGPRHPSVIRARAEIADIQRKVRTEIARVIGSLRQEARTSDARYQALQKNFDRLKSQMGGVNEKSIHLEALEREATVNRNLLEAMLSRAKEAIGRQELEQPDARLISPAAPPEGPSYPPKHLIVFLGTLSGTLIGCLVALLRESVDRTFHRADQLESATSLPVIAMVPNLRGGTPPTVHVLRKPISPYSEALRKIYIGLELSEPARSPKSVMFCSATPSEGKSIMVASLGRLLASNGKRVMLIDCDWRRPTLHRMLRCSNKKGLVALLTDERVALNEIIHNDALSGLDLIPAGDWNPNSVHALTSERMRLILQTFAKNYDLVILDSPPVLVGAEVLQLSRMVDKSIFVVRWGHTHREAALEALKQLVDAQTDLAGAVLSRVDPKRYRQYSYGHLNYEYARSALTRLG